MAFLSGSTAGTVRDVVQAVMRTAQPANFERAAVIVVMGLAARFSADFAGLWNESAVANGGPD
jgi:hypothetical protein